MLYYPRFVAPLPLGPLSVRGAQPKAEPTRSELISGKCAPDREIRQASTQTPCRHPRRKTQSPGNQSKAEKASPMKHDQLLLPNQYFIPS